MRSGKHKRPSGQLRRSQVVTTFGPGSMVDLPKASVLIAGLNHWRPNPPEPEIRELRLLGKLRALLDRGDLRLYAPPPDTDSPTGPPTGITAWQFPEWFVTRDVKQPGDGRSAVRARYLVHRKALTRGEFNDPDRKKRPVVPVRFVRACPAGHIADIDWRTFVHHGRTACHRQLWMDERGTSGDISEISIRCECGQTREMMQAANIALGALGNCDGSRPWLGPYAKESCGQPNRLLVRTASNAYFPQLMSVISLPDPDETISRRIDQVWTHHLQYVEDLDDLQRDRKKKAPVKAALEGLSDEKVLEHIEARRRGTTPGADKSVKQAELETLLGAADEIGADRPEGDFYARNLPRESWDEPWMVAVERVVLVHRLREVVAQAGFTRFQPIAPDIDGELDMEVRRAELGLETNWLPAVENRGEGVFLAFAADAVERWLETPAVEERGRQLLAGFEKWRQGQNRTRREFPGLPYIMLHSLSHLLVTAVSLECGYPASSIRERVYARPGVGYGILLYTGTPDAEGTLGGLIEAGRQIARHVRAALDLGRLCSNDPVCAQHVPESAYEDRLLHGAACHGCVLIAETSCEMHNDFLDRALVVPTVDGSDAAFFQDHVG